MSVMAIVKDTDDKRRGRRAVIFSVLLLSVSVAVVILGGARVGEYFTAGLDMAARRVLPTAFPFMILSSLVCCMIDPLFYSYMEGPLGALFGLGGAAGAPLIVGNLTGFPIGARMTAELCLSGAIDRDEGERLSAYASNPSPAFVVGAVGEGLLGDRSLGVMLLLSLYAAVVLSAIIYRGKSPKIKNTYEICRQKYGFVASIKDAATSSLYMLAFVSFFYIITSAVREAVKPAPLAAIIIALTEVTGAVSYAATEGIFSPFARVGIIAFSLGFGGLSVLAQVAAVTECAKLRLTKYIKIKLTEGLLSAIIAMGFFYIFG